jgi:hypothetical protein
MEKNDKYLETKRRYNSNLSSFQITKELHSQIKEYCRKNNLKVRSFIEETIKDKLINL